MEFGGGERQDVVGGGGEAKSMWDRISGRISAALIQSSRWR